MKGYFFIIAPIIFVISLLITLNIFFQQSLQQELAEQFNIQQAITTEFAVSQLITHLSVLMDELEFISSAAIIVKPYEKNYISKFMAINSNMTKTGSKVSFGLIGLDGLKYYSADLQNLMPVLNDIKSIASKQTTNKSVLYETNVAIYIILQSFLNGQRHDIFFYEIHKDDFIEYIFSSSKSTFKGYPWVISKQGTLLYHPTQPGMVGGNIYNPDKRCFRCHTDFSLQKKLIDSTSTTLGRYITPSGEDKIIAISPLNFDSISWFIAFSSPYSEVTNTTRQSMQLYSYLIISIFIATSIISGMLIIFNKRNIQAQELAKRQKALQDYANQLEQSVSQRTAELVSEKEKLNTIVSAIGCGIIMIDRQAKIIWTNELMKEIAGSDIVGHYCEEVLGDCFVSSYQYHDKKNKYELDTIIVSNVFKKNCYYQITTAPIIGEDNEIHGYIRLVQDITEIKNMQTQIEHSERLSSIGRLAAGIAHEIGNPLTSIFSFVQILRENEDDPLKKENLDIIHFHINRITEILKQLSGFTKMPSGEELESCVINEVLESSISLIQYDKKAKNIILHKDLFPQLPEIKANCNQLAQVFLNMILNAIDAMPDGGRLKVSSKHRDKNIVITFEDSGVGIDKEDLTKIFDPFYTTKEKGTGLGLSVSYNIIKKFGGSIDVESEIGKGTIFTITLPIKSS